MNPVELLLFSASAEIISKNTFLDPVSASHIEWCALKILALGMRKGGFRYRQGILSYDHFYEGMAAFNYVAQKAA